MIKVAVVGAGLAGSECAWILADKFGLDVTLIEMKPQQMTPAQSMPGAFAELVCSNSLKSVSRLNPSGLLKNEMQALGSLIVKSAYNARVPAGEALAVDRDQFSGFITSQLTNHSRVHVLSRTINSIKDVFGICSFDAVVIATGPLTTDEFSKDLCLLTESENLYFYDAIAPILDGQTIDRSVAYYANRESRWQTKNDVETSKNKDNRGDYLNLPLTKEQYLAFVAAVVCGDKVPYHNFEDPLFFNGCQPIEVLAESGPLTLAHGPMKGRGLTDPKTGRWPFAAVQLRREKLGDDTWNMVGFQTRLTWTAQKTILKTLPGLGEAEFFRMGSMHRNTYFIAPTVLNSDFSLKADPRIYLSGQIMGVEGYLESAAMGLWIGYVVGSKLIQKQRINAAPFPLLPFKNTALGVLARYPLQAEAKGYTPMNIHWGLFDPLSFEEVSSGGVEYGTNFNLKKLGKSEKRHLLALRAEREFESFLQHVQNWILQYVSYDSCHL